MIYKEDILEITGLICFWDFQEETGSERIAKGPFEYKLKEMGGAVERADNGIFGPYSARIYPGRWFAIPRVECPALDIHGEDAQVTVIAWIKRDYKEEQECQAVAGMWNETQLMRQYCLFIDLKIWESSDQICGHVSSTGGPTQGFKYCMDAAIGNTPIQLDEWHCTAFTYDGTYAKAYLDGRLDTREGRNPYKYEGGLFDGGRDGADFTVGAVYRKGEMGNWFSGQIGGLAVFNRALSEEEMGTLNPVIYQTSTENDLNGGVEIALKKDELTSRERILLTMNHKMPDRVPVQVATSYMVPPKMTGKPYWDVFYYKNPPLWKAVINTVKFFKYDGYMFSSSLVEYKTGGDDLRKFKTEIIRHDEEYLVTKTVCETPDGELWCETTYPAVNPPTVTRGYVKTLKDFKIYLKYFYPKVETADASLLQEARKLLGNDGVISGDVTIPGLHMLTDLFDGKLESASYMYYDYPELFEEYREKEEETQIRRAEMLLSMPDIDYIQIASSGLLTLQTPSMLRELSLPALKKITKLCKEAGKPSELHACGKERMIVEMCYNETDLDSINPLQPPPMGDCDLAEIKKSFGDKLCIKGNVGITFPMLTGTPDDVEKDVIKCLEAAKEGGNYILFTEEQVGRDTPHDNLFRFIEVGKALGRY